MKKHDENNMKTDKLLEKKFKIPEGIKPQLESKEVWQEGDTLLLKVTHTIEIPKVWTEEESTMIPICLYSSLWEDQLTEKQRKNLGEIFDQISQRISAKNEKKDGDENK